MPRILLIEDNAELAAAIRHNLEFEGYEIEVAGDGPAGIEAVRSFAPDEKHAYAYRFAVLDRVSEPERGADREAG